MLKCLKNLKAWEHTFNIMLSRNVGYEIFIQNDLRDIKIYEQNEDVKILPIVIAVDEFVDDRYSQVFQRSYINRIWTLVVTLRYIHSL